MFHREMQINFKSFLIWACVVIGVFLVVFLVYPSISNSENIQMMNEMMAMFPKELLKAFNMDLSSIDTAYGWLKSEGFIMILLIIGAYAGILGSQILLKEENDKTIEYLNSLPVKRDTIVFHKVLAGFLYILFMVLVIGIFNFWGLLFSGAFDIHEYILLSITPLFPASVIYFVCLFFSTFAKKTKKTFGFSLGFVLVSYVFQILSTLADTTDFLKYFSVFTLADLRNVITNGELSLEMILVTILLCFFFFFGTIIRYRKKELV